MHECIFAWSEYSISMYMYIALYISDNTNEMGASLLTVDLHVVKNHLAACTCTYSIRNSFLCMYKCGVRSRGITLTLAVS